MDPCVVFSRIDYLDSREFLLHTIWPELHNIEGIIQTPPPLSTYQNELRNPPKPTPTTRRFRALDVGAGIGRVTAKTLLPLFSDVMPLEPVESLLGASSALGTASKRYSRNNSKLPYDRHNAPF